MRVALRITYVNLDGIDCGIVLALGPFSSKND